MLYKNLKTQSIIDVPCEIKGEYWVAVDEPAKEPKPKKKAKEVKKDE